MNRGFVCIHGHFYQPPRENPWLEAIEPQETAAPYHDWNERIAVECYAPNAWSRILDGDGRITEIVNNYARISFNFGPTLLAWMESRDPGTYQAILQADRESRERFAGHGNALAQGYNHIILPLADARDLTTQVRWGIRDFEHRFGRRPEGMWLPETAADTATLEALAAEGLAFTILAPRQARAVRAPDAEEWTAVDESTIDPSRPYRVELPSGRSITVFFYDGPLSQAVAFDGMLRSGDAFADRLVAPLEAHDRPSALVHIATDGETFGHHHRHGEMALSWALERIERDPEVELINYGAYLERHPAEWRAEIHDGSSWSCVHGVERWRSDCGCRAGRGPNWTQGWRGPLRAALDGLRDRVRPLWESAAAQIFDDPWAARDGYIDVVLDRGEESMERFFAAHTGRAPDGEERVRALELMELQRHAMLMYTSCGWFFDEISDLETAQVLQYAGRVVELAASLFDVDVETEFLEGLAAAPSNLPRWGDGRTVYQRIVGRARVELSKVAAHHAVISLFEPGSEEVYGYRVEVEDRHVVESGRTRLAYGRSLVRSAITGRSGRFTSGVLHLGDQNLVGGVRPFQGEEEYRELTSTMRDAFDTGDLPSIVRTLDEHFSAGIHSLRSLFRDEQLRVLDRLLGPALERSTDALERVYEEHSVVLRFLVELDAPLPPGLQRLAEQVLAQRLRSALHPPAADLDVATDLVREAEQVGAELAEAPVAHAARAAVLAHVQEVAASPDDPTRLAAALSAAGLARALPFDVDLWEAQNVFHGLIRSGAAGDNDNGGGERHERLRALGAALRVAVP